MRMWFRVLFPTFFQGKRSMSDHMGEAVNYIKHLQAKIRELSFKRDELKSIYSLAALDSPSSDSSCSTTLTVNSCCESVEIVISRSIRDKDLLLSTVTELLLQQGLDVVSCFSSQAYDRIVHTIHCELVSNLSYSYLCRFTKFLSVIYISFAFFRGWAICTTWFVGLWERKFRFNSLEGGTHGAAQSIGESVIAIRK